MDFEAGEGFDQTAVRVVPATAEQSPRLGHVFGPQEKDPNSCWCQRFLRHEESDNRSALGREVQDAEVPIGLLAYLDDDDVVGWTRVVPRSTLPGITENRALARILDDDPDAGGCPASWCAANTEGRASELRCSTPRWTGQRSMVPPYSKATPLTPAVSPAPRRHLPSSLEHSPCSSEPGSPRSGAPTQPDQ